MSGVNTRLLFATDKMTAVETQNSISVDSYLMTYLYPTFNAFLDYHINKFTKKFKFKFTLEGTEFEMDKTKRLDDALKLAAVGIVLPQKIASGMDMLPQDLERQMEMAMASEFTDKLIMLMNAYTSTDGAEGTSTGKVGQGAPKKPINKLKDSGITTRDAGSNVSKGGKV
jgi:hypothetical protein